MDALSIPRAHLLGISMGGRIALETAMSYPTRVDKLVLVSTSAAGRGKVHMSLPMRLLRCCNGSPCCRASIPSPSTPTFANARRRSATTPPTG